MPSSLDSLRTRANTSFQPLPGMFVGASADRPRSSEPLPSTPGGSCSRWSLTMLWTYPPRATGNMNFHRPGSRASRTPGDLRPHRGRTTRVRTMRRHRGTAIVSTMSEGLRARIDGFQRRHRITGFTYVVIKRYYEDHGPWLGSLISYYGFFSLYPAVIVLVTVSTWLFSDRP